MTKCNTCETKKFYDNLIGKKPHLTKNQTNSKILQRFNKLLKKGSPIVKYAIDRDNNILAEFQFQIKI